MRAQDALEGILSLPEGSARTAAVAAWFQSLYDDETSKPVLVGGAAVELYTKGAYTTGDLDFVGQVPKKVARLLEEVGFHKEGRHWIHERGEIFIELPGASLDPLDRTVVIEISGSKVLTSSPEGLIVDRLASWQFWKVEADAANAFLIWKAREKELDRRLLESLARHRRVERALRSLEGFVRRLEGRDPSQSELDAWSGMQR